MHNDLPLGLPDLLTPRVWPGTKRRSYASKLASASDMIFTPQTPESYKRSVSRPGSSTTRITSSEPLVWYPTDRALRCINTILVMGKSKYCHTRLHRSCACLLTLLMPTSYPLNSPIRAGWHPGNDISPLHGALRATRLPFLPLFLERAESCSLFLLPVAPFTIHSTSDFTQRIVRGYARHTAQMGTSQLSGLGLDRPLRAPESERRYPAPEAAKDPPGALAWERCATRIKQRRSVYFSPS